MAKEHRIVVNTIRISLTPGGGEGDFLSGNTRASSSNPRIYATLAWILRDCKEFGRGREREREGGWRSEEGEGGKEGDPFPMIYSTVFLTSITWPNNCRFIEDLYRWLKKKEMTEWFVLVCCLMEMVFWLDCLLLVREVLLRGMIEWLGDGNEMIYCITVLYIFSDEWFGNKIRSIIILFL